MRKSLVLIVFIGLIYPSFSQETGLISKELTEALEQVYKEDHIVGFSVAIVNKEGFLYKNGFGHSNKSDNEKYTENTIQNIASISKTFIGVALLKAHELGKLHFDDPINAYLPFRVQNPYHPDIPITIRQLATHTSSIKDPSRYEKNGYVLLEHQNDGTIVKANFQPPEEMISQPIFLEYILSEEGKWYRKSNFLKDKPGVQFSYSNIAAGLAALVLEYATGQPFHEFTIANIFEPLDMLQTGWFRNEIDISKHSKLYNEKGTELAAYQLVNYPDGALITSSNDLGKYLTELISGYSGNGHILNRKSFETLFKPGLLEENYKVRNESAYNDEYNMGVFMGLSAQNQIGHTGGDPGVVTHMFFNAKTSVGKILIINTDLDKEGINEFIEIWGTLEEYENKL